jgi:hypothetical protein
MNRYTDHNLWDGIVKKYFDEILDSVDYMIPQVSEGANDKDICLRRSLVLKCPRTEDGRTVEKGILLISFTTTFDYYYRVVNIDGLLKDYYVVLEPSWAGYCDASILQWARFDNHKIIIQSTERKDRIFLNSLDVNFVPVDFGASDWVDFRIFHPIFGVEKIYDSIYVTSYRAGKRHHVYLRAIAKMNDSSYRAAFACGKWGKSKQTVLDLISYYGVEKNIDIYESLRQDELNLLLNKAKVNVLFSKKEGSNRSIFEAFFAGVPGLVLKNNIGMNKEYINKYTGLLVDENEVCDTLLYFRDNWMQFKPHEWAMENISPLKTTDKLNSALKSISIQEGMEWTADIVPKVNCPEVAYFTDFGPCNVMSTDDLLQQYKK